MGKRSLSVDMEAIVDAMDMGDAPFTSFFNTRDGKVTEVMSDSALDFDHEDEEDANAAAEIYEDPDWVEIPLVEGRDDYRLMERFTASIDEEDIRDMLQLALCGRGAFSRFKDVIHRYPDIQARWYATRKRALVEQATEWLAALGISPEYELREPEASAMPAPTPGIGTAEPDLLDVLLLAQTKRGNELVDGCVIRRCDTGSAGAANRVFKKLAREICELCGVAWRKRYVQGKATFDMERLHLEKRGTVVELRIEVNDAVFERLSGERLTR